MTGSPPEQVTALAAEVVDLSITQMLVRLGSATFSSEPPVSGNLEVHASIALGVTWETNESGAGRFVLSSRYTIEAVHPAKEGGAVTDERNRASDDSAGEEDDPKQAWSCEVEMQGQWVFADAAHLTPDNLRAFAARVGIMTLHPYARARIQMLVTESGWPPYTLDVLTSQDELFADQSDPTLLDLDGITVDVH